MALLPNTLRYDGHYYNKVVIGEFDDNISAISTGIESAVLAFDQFMIMHQEGDVAKALPHLVKVFDGTYAAAKACQLIFQEVVPEQRQASVRKVRYSGRVYTAVEHPYESLDARNAEREYEVGVAHLDSVMKDSITVATRARDLLQALNHLKAQASDALSKHPDKLNVNEVDALNGDYRVDNFKDPLRSLNKANQSLNYTVDAATAAIKVVLDQVDALVDDWDARMDSLNSPHPSKELTKPMLMSDNPAAVFDELGGL